MTGDDDGRLSRTPQYFAGDEELPGDPPDIRAAVRRNIDQCEPFDHSGDPAPAETSHANGNGSGPTPIVVPPADLAPELAPEPEPAGPSAADLAAEIADEICDERPILKHLHTFARARGVAPLAVLAVAMARTVAMVPAGIVTPPYVGVDGTLNLFVALVGPSGAGKGAAHGVATEALHTKWLDPISGEDELYEIGVGSGEGIMHTYVYRKRDAKELTRVRESALFTAAEVDTIKALVARVGSTLSPQLRQLYSGERLSFAYVDPTKRLALGAHTYRASMTVGVQPLKAWPLFEDADGGTPQRFFWVPVQDPRMPHFRDRPEAPPPVSVALPAAPTAGTRLTIPVAAVAADEIKQSHWERNHGIGDPLDGHSLYTRLKVAAALSLLEGRLVGVGVTDDDWRLSGLLMRVSDATRGSVQRELASRASAENRDRGKREGERAAVKDGIVEDATVQRVCSSILARLRKTPGVPMSGGPLRRLQNSVETRAAFDKAINLLVESGQVMGEEFVYSGQTGWKYWVKP